MTDTNELRIARTWDGAVIPRSEQVVFLMCPEASALRIEVEAPFHDDPPPLGPRGPTDGLWDFEVVELFIVGADEPGGPPGVVYIELELSPHGHYLLLRLRGIRQAVERRLRIDYRASIQDDRWRGEARLPFRLLPPAE